MINYKEIEPKWQKAWADAKIFEPDQNGKNPILITAAWPYVNTPPHIGHLRTYGTADFYAKYMRMRGYNALFPMGWHFTGTPILAIAKRIAAKDKSLLEELKEFEISEEDISKMTDPLFIANFFKGIFKESFIKAGFGIDWRREFTSIDPLFSKMVEWQFENLMRLGLLVKGNHPVGWCTNDNSAVGQHDTKGDVQPEIERMFGIKFAVKGEEASFICATYRPETIYGVSNLFINGKAEYVLAKAGDERYYISKPSVQMLAGQMDLLIEKDVEPSELLSKTAINPVDKSEITVLDGFFVKPDFGTGVVMSVPAHAPFDLVALKRLEASGINVPKAFKAIIKTDGMQKDYDGMLPSERYIKDLGLDIATAAQDKIEEATKKIYKDEQRHGTMTEGAYKGLSVSAARESVAKDLESAKAMSYIYIMANEKPVFCRCGQRVIVKIINDQWFIDYGNREWKAKVLELMPSINIYPEKYAAALNATVEWIDLRAAERAQGLGTKFPFDKTHIIESLSDSTIYMSFYTIVPILRQYGIKPENLTFEFFDFIIKESTSEEAAAKATGIDIEVLKKCKESFDYWYRYTSRHSASELIPSHITMYMFNHVALFRKEYWPKQIVLNGMINYKGQKMSKSLGNVIPLLKAIREYGADPIRFVEVVSGDLSTDTDFSPEGVESVNSKINYIDSVISQLQDMDAEKLTHIDYWMYSRLNSKIKSVTSYMDQLSLRNAYVEAFYESFNELKWYFDRGGRNQLVVSDYIENVLLMLAPAIPHVSEELWHELGKNSFILTEHWPEADESMISGKTEAIEQMLRDAIEDVSKAEALTAPRDKPGAVPSGIRLILPAQWKIRAYNALATEKSIGKAMSDKSLEGIAEKEKVSKFLSRYAKSIASIKPLPEIGQKELFEAFSQASDFMSARFGCQVKIEAEEGSDSDRAERAEPDKPSIDIKWS